MRHSALLIINSGSSSVKFRLFSNTEKLDLLAKGKVINIGGQPSFIAVNEMSEHQSAVITLEKEMTHEKAIHLILDWISQQQQNWEIHAVAHRVVHGGEYFTQSVLVTPQIISQLETLSSLAPLHQPHNLAAIKIINRIKPELPQIACFDTAFHAQHTPLFTACALPEYLRQHGIRRYGFHGLSYEWISLVLKQDYPDLANSRIIMAHLGNGASLCAMHKGVSIDTTMSLTALDGLPMGTRCGSLDPGAIIYMMRELNLTPGKVEEILYNESGLLGLSGQTNNMQELQSSSDKNAQFALEYFCLKTAQFIGMMAISLDGVDGIVFTGGIGENSELIRANIFKRIQCLQPFSVIVIPANEEKMMAMHTLTALRT
ncbi:TPA: acetate/propionate family kinase [Legionella pneumophila]|nr:acetate/propionate family kinase [Legionella pneumophila]HAU1320802.1 acetate/propionate family kinase [Legionella pneumophila]HBC0467789.1 acetate/propionate family kinase [Legionella pneumophila]HBD9374454.1 acetate/propionate family kinase [Legionella pneumophila]HBI2946430.1 acetate/propionate family kinase [Legionella pneumophila]